MEGARKVPANPCTDLLLTTVAVILVSDLSCIHIYTLYIAFVKYTLSCICRIYKRRKWVYMYIYIYREREIHIVHHIIDRYIDI